MERLLTTYRDFGELATAAEGMLPCENPVVLTKLRTALKGAADADADANPVARNTQFELFVASLLRLAGLAVEWREPDLAFLLNGAVIGVAIKRLGSSAKFPKLLREGGRQLKRANLRGIVAMNVDVLVPRPQRTRIADRLADFAPLTTEEVVERLDAQEGVAAHAVRRMPVIAILGIIVIPCVVTPERRIGHATNVLVRGILANSTASETASLAHLAQALGSLTPPL